MRLIIRTQRCAVTQASLHRFTYVVPPEVLVKCQCLLLWCSSPKSFVMTQAGVSVPEEMQALSFSSRVLSARSGWREGASFRSTVRSRWCAAASSSSYTRSRSGRKTTLGKAESGKERPERRHAHVRSVFSVVQQKQTNVARVKLKGIKRERRQPSTHSVTISMKVNPPSRRIRGPSDLQTQEAH